MGIHTGPVYRIDDINASRNVAGGGINIAQRVMDCGGAGHILVSKASADVLREVSAWRESLHDIGEREVKHGVRVHLYSLHTDKIGNASSPSKLARARKATGQRRWRRLVVGGVAAAVVAGVVLWLVLFAHRAPALTIKDTIVLADFDNRTGDPVFNDTLKQALRIGLEQSPFLNVVSERKVGQVLKLMNREPGQRVAGEIARDICRRVGSKAMVAGSIASLGNQFVVGLDAVNCNTGESLVAEQVRASGKEEVLKALDGAAASMRSKLGESLRSVQKFAAPLEKVTTSSLEALQAYSMGVKVRSDKGDAEALRYFKEAIDLDANFALAYDVLGTSYANLGEMGPSSWNLTKAYDLRRRVSERERYRIAHRYHALATGDLDQARDDCEIWARTYPQDSTAVANLATTSMVLGEWEQTLPLSQHQFSMPPPSVIGYVVLAMNYLGLGRLNEAQATLDESQAKGLDYVYTRLYRYHVAFVRGDAAAMRQELTAAPRIRDAENWLTFAESNTEAYYGRLRAASELSRRAINTARVDSKEIAALWQSVVAVRDVELGHAASAQREASASLAIGGNESKLLAAIALARAGDTATVISLADELNRDRPHDTIVQNYCLPVIRAALSLRAHDGAKALEQLQPAQRYELSLFPRPLGLGMLYPPYLRGEAYLAQQNPLAAAVEFRKLIDHGGIVVNFPLVPLARLGLARAYALQGDTAKARNAYQDFLTLWKDADPDIPVLKQAKAEYAKLK